MKERPILFSGPMVRAILDGRKTQTRRVVKLNAAGRVKEPGSPRNWHLDDPDAVLACPYGQPGERLWVRETFKAVASGEVKNGYGEVRYGFAYQADGATRWQEHPTIIHDLTGQPPTGPMQFNPVPWKPSIHMPRKASRITLEISGVRVERLNDICELHAQKEGAPLLSCGYDAKADLSFASHVKGFSNLWESINGHGSWEKNPWVWVIEFRRL